MGPRKTKLSLKLDDGDWILVRMTDWGAQHNNRQALRYIIRNTTLPPRVRATAQLQLTQMHCYTNPTQIRNRCILGGKGRGILSDFKLSRVRPFLFFLDSTNKEKKPDWWRRREHEKKCIVLALFDV